MIEFFLVVFGILIGSFLNVLILRLPLEENVTVERSRCPNCKKNIFWYENIPVISYILLKGRCSGCKTKISLQYPIVEIISGIVAFLLLPQDFSIEAIILFFFYLSIYSCFLVHFIIDIRHQILPDEINIYLAVLFFVYGILHLSWQNMLLGAGIGLFFPLGVTYLFLKIRGVVGMGGGDIKLFAALGILLGPLGIFYNIFLSCMLGSVVTIVLILSKRINKDTPFAFGPYILIVATFQIFFPKYFQTFVHFLM